MPIHARPPVLLATISLASVLALSACGGTDPGPAASSSSTTTSPTSSGTSTATPSSSTGDATTSTGPSTSATSTTSSTSGRALAVTVTGSTVTPRPSQVDLAVGETLTLTVTSDHADELHAHGFEVEQALTAGVPATITLTGSEPGVYEVETHEPALLLLTVAVR